VRPHRLVIFLALLLYMVCAYEIDECYPEYICDFSPLLSLPPLALVPHVSHIIVVLCQILSSRPSPCFKRKTRTSARANSTIIIENMPPTSVGKESQYPATESLPCTGLQTALAGEILYSWIECFGARKPSPLSCLYNPMKRKAYDTNAWSVSFSFSLLCTPKKCRSATKARFPQMNVSSLTYIN
jgi:hypothetical protein